MSTRDLRNKNEDGTPRRTMIAYHANCNDGFTAGWVTYYAMTKEGHDCNMVEMHYNSESHKALLSLIAEYKVQHLYVVDYSLPVDLLQWLNGKYPKMKIVVLDHHKTAFENYFPDLEITPTTYKHGELHGATIILDNRESGASLCWKYFYSEEALQEPKLVMYVKDYDLWKFEHGMETKYVNKYLSSIEKDLAQWGWIAHELEYPHGLMHILSEGKTLQIEHDKKVAEYVKLAAPLILKKVTGMAVQCPAKYSSDVGNALAKIKGTFGATYAVDEVCGKVKWSLRSNGDFDVSAIAKSMGGGGHKNAAGFEVKFTSKSKGEQV